MKTPKGAAQTTAKVGRVYVHVYATGSKTACSRADFMLHQHSMSSGRGGMGGGWGMFAFDALTHMFDAT